MLSRDRVGGDGEVRVVPRTASSASLRRNIPFETKARAKLSGYAYRGALWAIRFSVTRGLFFTSYVRLRMVHHKKLIMRSSTLKSFSGHLRIPCRDRFQVCLHARNHRLRVGGGQGGTGKS